MKIITTSLTKRLSYSEDKSIKILKYDTDNRYPQNLSLITGGSGTASSCIDIFTKFIVGKGFKQNGDKIVNDTWINPFTLNKILRLVASDYAKFNGFALHVNYNANYKISSISHVPFEYCRFGIPDDYHYISTIAVYDNWDRSKSTRLMRDDIYYLDIYNPNPDVIKAQVERDGNFRNYKGQILYYSGDGDYTYPKAKYDSVLEDIETDGNITTFKYKSIRNGFSAGHIFVYKGSFESDSERQKFAQNLNNFQGPENTGTMMLVEVDIDEQKPEIQKVEVMNIDKVFEYTEKSIQDNIRKINHIPPVLLGDLVVGRLGTAEEILDATILYNAFTEDDRTIMEQTFTELMKMYKSPIKSPLEIEELTLFSEEVLANRKNVNKINENGGNKTDSNE